MLIFWKMKGNEFGQPARYVSQEAANKRRSLLITALLVMGGICLIWGICVGLSLQAWFRFSIWICDMVSFFGLLAISLIGRWSLLKLNQLETKRLDYQSGVYGENQVAHELNRLPQDFKIIHDITTAAGNLDHVVVGPSGVFILDAKNWRGVVSSDAKGELLLNQKPIHQPHIKQFTARIVHVKKQIKTLAGLDPYFHGVFVFTAARVDANWGTTGKVDCIRDSRLFDYIVDRRGKRLTRAEVEKIVQAFLSLAQRDIGFAAKAWQTERPLASAIVNS